MTSGRALTNKQRFFRAHGLAADATLSLEEIARLSKMPKAALQEVYNRGVGAWKTNIASVRVRGSFEKNPDTRRFPRSARLGRQQWAHARVYSFVMRTPSDFYGADKYIAEKYGLLGSRGKKTNVAKDR